MDGGVLTGAVSLPRLRARVVGVALALVLFKLWLAAVFPMTGDEAYFILWGEHPAWGYYDHPPMVGWMLAPIVALTREAWALRLPVVLAPALMAAMLYAALRRAGEERALLAALAFLLVPLHVWNIFITTDTPLVLASLACALAYWKGLERCADRRGSARWFAAAGVCLGLAFLSKYFSGLLAFALLAHCLAAPRGARPWRGLAITYACAIPFGLVNLAWNYGHCWANFMFNLYNRHGDAGLSWKTPLLYALSVLYLLSVPALAQLARGAAAGRWKEPGVRFFAVMSVLPLAVFALLSPVKLIGLHWLWSFVPLFFALAALALDAAQLRKSVLFLGVLGAVHVAAILAAAALPLEAWRSTRLYDGIVFHARIGAVLEEMRRAAGAEPQGGGGAPGTGVALLAADGYSAAATLGFFAGSDVAVFGSGSSHARHDDLVSDFRAFEGRDVVILRRRLPSGGTAADEYAPFFRAVEPRSFALEGVNFHLVIGRGFRYEPYREAVLVPARDRWYRIPAYLPQGGCVFCDRYFGSFCPART